MVLLNSLVEFVQSEEVRKRCSEKVRVELRKNTAPDKAEQLYKMGHSTEQVGRTKLRRA